MPERPLNDSDRQRSILKSTVDGLAKKVDDMADEQDRYRDHMRQFWQFMVGQTPNGHVERICPTETSWCGQMSAGIKTLQRTTYFICGTFLAFGLIDNRAAVMELVKTILK